MKYCDLLRKLQRFISGKGRNVPNLKIRFGELHAIYKEHLLNGRLTLEEAEAGISNFARILPDYARDVLGFTKKEESELFFLAAKEPDKLKDEYDKMCLAKSKALDESVSKVVERFSLTSTSGRAPKQ